MQVENKNVLPKFQSNVIELICINIEMGEMTPNIALKSIVYQLLLALKL